MRRGALFGNGIGQRDGAPIAATVAERSGAWTGKTERSHQETCRKDYVLDSAGDSDGAVGKPCKLGQSRAQRVQMVGVRQEDTTTTPQRKGATKGSEVVRTASQHDHKVGAPRGQDTTTGDQQRQGNESAVERTARQHNHKIGAPRSQAEQHKPLRFARAKSLEQQSVEIERVPNCVNSKSKHKLNSVCGTEKRRITITSSFVKVILRRSSMLMESAFRFFFLRFLTT